MVRTAKTVTAYGNAQIDTAQSKFGGASSFFDTTYFDDTYFDTGVINVTDSGGALVEFFEVH